MRPSSATRPLSSGTLRSARTSTQRPSTATSPIIFMFVPHPLSGCVRDDGDRAVGVVEDRVLDRSDAGTSAMRVTMPTKNHEVRPGRIAGQHPRGVPISDIPAPVHGRVLVL